MAVHPEEPWHRRQNLRPAYAHSFWWFMFGNGGAIAAIFLPVIILVSGILGPLFGAPSWMQDSNHFGWVLSNPLVKLFLVVLCFLTFVHAAHRMIAILVDLGVRLEKRLIGYFFYALAIVLTLVAAGLIFTTP